MCALDLCGIYVAIGDLIDDLNNACLLCFMGTSKPLEENTSNGGKGEVF